MNEAYPMVEKRLAVPSAGLSSINEHKPTGVQEGEHLHGGGSNSSSQRISRQQLGHAHVIGQVDRKFVGCLLHPQSHISSASSRSATAPTTNAETLILVDQHAADERIRVESFLRPLCIGFLHSRSGGTDPEEATAIIRSTPPCPVLLTRRETSLLNGSAGIRDFFRCWGISFQDNPAKGSERDSSIGGNGDFEQVLVTTLPEVVSDKVSLFVIRISICNEWYFSSFGKAMNCKPCSKTLSMRFNLGLCRLINRPFLEAGHPEETVIGFQHSGRAREAW